MAAARELLDWSQEDLAKAAGIARVIIARFEKARTRPHQATIDTIRQTLESRGIVFTNSDKPSVTLDRSKAVHPT